MLLAKDQHARLMCIQTKLSTTLQTAACTGLLGAAGPLRQQ
jgi:hypothetical protein